MNQDMLAFLHDFHMFTLISDLTTSTENPICRPMIEETTENRSDRSFCHLYEG